MTDGKYQVKFSDVSINNAKSESARLQVSFEMTILNTEFRGRKLFTHFGIEDEEQRGFLRGALAKLGVDWPAKAADLPDVLDELKGTFGQVTAKTRKKKDKDTGEYIERQNIWIDRALDSADVDDLDTDADEPGEAEEADQPAKQEEEKKPTNKKKDKDPEPESAEGVEITFEDSDINPRLKKDSQELAKTHDFDPKDYSNTADLLADIAEYVGVTGKFDKPIKLINAIKEVKPKK